MAEKLFNGRRAFWYKWISYRADFIGTDPSIYRFIANSLATLHICNYCIYKKNRVQNSQHLKLAGTLKDVSEFLFRFLSSQKCPVCYAGMHDHRGRRP
jgi:hypothetical protein